MCYRNGQLDPCCDQPACRQSGKIVIGAGVPDAKEMIIGEAPGRQEQEQGHPFVGDAGGVLNAFLGAAGATRDQFFITNVMKCRTVDDKGTDRPPTVQERELCLPLLGRQIRDQKPEKVLLLGETAVNALIPRVLRKYKTLKQIPRQFYPVHSIGGVSLKKEVYVFPTFHPSPRNPEFLHIGDDIKKFVRETPTASAQRALTSY